MKNVIKNLSCSYENLSTKILLREAKKDLEKYKSRREQLLKMESIDMFELKCCEYSIKHFEHYISQLKKEL